MTAVSISKARENLFPLVRQVNEDSTVIEIVSKDGNAVLMSADDYESLKETLYLFSTRANTLRLVRALDEAESGLAREVTPEALAAEFGVDL